MNMRSVIAITLAAITLVSTVASTHATAQDFASYQQRQKDLVAISAVFGVLHHIRRTCEPRFEGDLWRERMKRLVELEEPQAAGQQEMVASFNKAYRDAQRRYVVCDRRARDQAALRAQQGDDIIARLTAPLYEVMAEDALAAENPDSSNERLQ